MPKEMKNSKIKLTLAAILGACVAVMAQAAAPAGYYDAAKGKRGAELKTALKAIITNGHTKRSYDYVWKAYYRTDVTADGRIWDMYSDLTHFIPGGVGQGQTQGGAEGTSYNREHSFPKSWFGEKTSSPAYTDLFHLIPTDAVVNSRRSNYIYGEVNVAQFKSHNDFSLLGSPDAELVEAGCTESTVFEPNDVYKGDVSRNYFYMLTRYEDNIGEWYASYSASNTALANLLDGSTYPGFRPWVSDMLLRWAACDPVGPKEEGRNDAIQVEQGNRNPFIDFPGLEQYIWGTMKNVAFDPDNYMVPSGCEKQEMESSLPYIAVEYQVAPKAKLRFVRVTSTEQIADGGQYLLVNEAKKAVVGVQNLNQLSSCDAGTIADGVMECEYLNQVGSPYILTLESDGEGKYYIQLSNDYYLKNASTSGSGHRLQSVQSKTGATAWEISADATGATIYDKGGYSHYVDFYSGSNFFYMVSERAGGTYLYKLEQPSVTIGDSQVPLNGTVKDGYSIERLDLRDGATFSTPTTFSAGALSYDRMLTAGKVITFVLPCSVAVGNINGTLYELEHFDGATLHFSLVDGLWTEPNKPYLLETATSGAMLYADEQDAAVEYTATAPKKECSLATQVGTYKKQTGIFSNDEHDVYGYVGGEFVRQSEAAPGLTGSTLNPFRTLIKIAKAGALSLQNIALNLGGTTTGVVSIADGIVREPESVDVYALDGRLVRKGADSATCLRGLPAGEYVVNGKVFKTY